MAEDQPPQQTKANARLRLLTLILSRGQKHTVCVCMCVLCGPSFQVDEDHSFSYCLIPVSPVGQRNKDTESFHRQGQGLFVFEEDKNLQFTPSPLGPPTWNNKVRPASRLALHQQQTRQCRHATESRRMFPGPQATLLDTHFHSVKAVWGHGSAGRKRGLGPVVRLCNLPIAQGPAYQLDHHLPSLENSTCA